MTVQQIKEMVLAIDPDAKHYYTSKQGNAFTVWGEYERAGQGAEDHGPRGEHPDLPGKGQDPAGQVSRALHSCAPRWRKR